MYCTLISTEQIDKLKSNPKIRKSQNVKHVRYGWLPVKDDFLHFGTGNFS